MALTKATYSMIDGAWANALDYGADPTGAADSTAALQAAINSGAPVYIPEGTYLTDVLTARNGKGMQFIGAGIGKTILQEKTLNTGILKNPSGIQFGGNIGQFSVKAHASSTGIGYGILVSGFYNTVFHHIEYLSNGSGYWESLFNVSAYPELCYGNTIDHLEAREQVGPKFAVLFSNGGQGIQYNANACTVNGGIVASNTRMVAVVNCARSISTTVSNMLLERNYETATITGLQADASLGINAGEASAITGNYFEELSPYIDYENPVDGGGNNGLVAGNHFSGTWATTTSFYNSASGNVWVGNDEDPAAPITFDDANADNWKIGGHAIPTSPTFTYASGTTGTLSNVVVTLTNNSALSELTYRVTADWLPTTSGATNVTTFLFSNIATYVVKDCSLTARFASNNFPVGCAIESSSNGAIVGITQTATIAITFYVTYRRAF